MSNQQSDMQPSVIDKRELTRLQQNIRDMNPMGVRTTYSDLPTQDYDVSIGIYDIDLGSGVIVNLTRMGTINIHMVYCKDVWKPNPQIVANNVTITPNTTGGYTVSDNEFNPDVPCKDMIAYDLLTFICKQWTTRLGWLRDIRARLYPTAPGIKVISGTTPDYDIASTYWQIQPHIGLRTPEENKFHAAELFVEQVQQYANFPGTHVVGCELSVNTTPVNRNDYDTERGFIVTHQPNNSDVPLVIETFNHEDDVIGGNLLINIQAGAVCQLGSLDTLIEYAVTVTPEEGIGPSMLEDFKNVKMISTPNYTHDNSNYIEPLFATIKQAYHTNQGSPFLEYIRIKTAFHGRLTRIVIGYYDDFSKKRTNTAVYSQVPLTGKEIMQTALDHCYRLESISGNTIASMVEWLQSIEPELAQLFGQSPN